MFNILDLDTEEYVMDETTGNALSFASGNMASDFCKKNSDKRLQPRKFVDNPKWELRERVRMENGEYKPVPSWVYSYQSREWHYLHMSKEKHPLLSYTKSKENGRADVQNRISWENYLKKYHGDILTKSELDRLLSRFEMDATPPTELKIATTPEDIAKVYTNYFSVSPSVAGSCMRHQFKGHPKHPTYAYGAGDLAIAYLTESTGKTIARALVWPEKKLYSRVYAENDHLHNLLKKEGYVKSAYHQTGGPLMVGARLLKIDIPGVTGVHLMPFIDEPIVVKLSEDKEFFVTVDPAQNQRRTFIPRFQTGTSNGYQLTDEGNIECAWCDCELNRRQATRVYLGRTDSEFICSECQEQGAERNELFFCNGEQRWYATSEVSSVEAANGDRWSTHFYEHHGFTCAKSGLIYHVREVQDVWISKQNFELWGSKAKDQYAWRCDRMNRWISNDIAPCDVLYQGGQHKWNPFSVALFEKEGKITKQENGSYVVK